MYDFYKIRLEEGYHLAEIDNMTFRDLQQFADIYEERETTIDEAFPFLF